MPSLRTVWRERRRPIRITSVKPGCIRYFQAEPDFDLNITNATFRANSTLDWHKHATAQVLIIVEGEAYYQERGKEPVVLKKGDVIKCAKDTEHWHTSTKQQSVTYLALYGGTQPTTWTEKLTQEYYDSVAQKLARGKR